MLYLKIERKEHIPLDSPANVPLNDTQTAARNLDMLLIGLSGNTSVTSLELHLVPETPTLVCVI
jgi:hypothetical protein